MEFNKRAIEYLQNEREMLEMLEKLDPLLKKREEMEKREPFLHSLRCFSLDLRDTEEGKKKKELENKKKAEEDRIRSEKKLEGKKRMEDLQRDQKKRGSTPVKTTDTNLDPTSSGQVL